MWGSFLPENAQSVCAARWSDRKTLARPSATDREHGKGPPRARVCAATMGRVGASTAQRARTGARLLTAGGTVAARQTKRRARRIRRELEKRNHFVQ